jgi:stearoyl-CoA 9-desaturase NADPH oxidoreductase
MQTRSTAKRIFGKFTDLFTYPLTTSHYKELMNPLWASHAIKARVEKVWDETKDARTITLRPSAAWRTGRAGQHVRIGLSIDGRQYHRTYSISSAPEREDGCFTITVKILEGGRLSRHLVRSLAIGDYVSVGLPQGDFHLPDAGAFKILFITAGSGVTPARSMVQSMRAGERYLDTAPIHYAPHEYDAIFGKELIAMPKDFPQYKYIPVYTRKLGNAARKKFHFSAAQLTKLCPDWREREIYACGPQDLLSAIRAHMVKAKLSHQLHIEEFRAPIAAIPKTAKGGTVKFSISDVEAKADGATSLLRVAEDAGLNPPHGCRMGICHTCDTTLVSGCVRDLRSGDLINEPGAKVQTCVMAAHGKCEINQ